ncbi:unnamed protein product [Clonostachys chloroleuca]|uniref:Uncharacterized protein n=1 Tax=Clonostachys chloroleuca TaxID=1926264 RepID=A0AA35MCS6_9HYPO|nr:unnamed protein product [Clonostachys chloroleuca]
MAAGHKIVPEDRVLLIGAAGVGKNSLIEQFCYGHVSEDYDPFRGEGCRKDITLDGEDGALDLLDVEFRGGDGMQGEHDFEGADAVMMVFSVASVESLRCAMEAYAWLRWQTMRAEGQVPVVLVGNMCDLAGLREVSTETGAQLARGLGMDYYETSAWNATGVERAFLALARAARQRRIQPRSGQEQKEAAVSRPGSQGDEDEELYGQPAQLMHIPPLPSHRLRGHRLLSWGRSKLNLGRPTSQLYMVRDGESRTQKIQEGLLEAARRNDEDMFACYLRAASHDADSGPRRSGSSSGSDSSCRSVAAVVHVAAEAGHGRILEMAMEHHDEGCTLLSEVNTPDAEGTPALQLAAKQGHSEVVRLLLRKGAMIDQTSPRYGTALSAAAMHRHEEVVGVLLEEGASLDVRSTVYGDLVQDLARMRDGRIAAHLEWRARRERECEAREREAARRREEVARLVMRELPPPPWHLKLDLPKESLDVDFERIDRWFGD